jgi:hypothetical protein
MAAMACDAVLQTGAPVPDGVLDSLPQEPGDEEGSPPVSQEPSGDKAEYSGEFLEADCACAGYTPSREFPWGNASVDCRYDWSGPNIDQNALGFSVVHYYHTDRLLPDFQKSVEDLTASLPPQVEGDHQGRELRNDDEGYAFFVYGPGGGGKQGDIPLCGNGRGVYQVAGEFLIETDLFVCDLPYSDQAYASALADMETCARRAVERIR